MLKQISTFFLLPFFVISVYTYNLPSANGGTIQLNDYRNKKILIVNTAQNSEFVSQYGSLEELYQTYQDSLVIIAVPSNSFGNEQGTDSSIYEYVSDNYNITYLLAGKVEVTGANSDPLFKWLASKSKNGTISAPVNGDFQKFLINASGQLIGVFSSSVDPMDEEMQNAIKGIF